MFLGTPIWHPLRDDPKFGIFNGLNEDVELLESSNPQMFTDVRHGSTLFVGLDDSGRHSHSRFLGFSFVIADLDHCQEWFHLRAQLRRDLLPDGRRMSFKGMNDPRKRRALIPFLQAANSIRGLCVSFLIEKNVSLFSHKYPLDCKSPEWQSYSHWPSHTLDRLFTAVSLTSFFVAGLARPGQSVLWITDEDEIAANESRVRELTTIVANVSSHFLSFDLAHLRCGTTFVDNGSREVEDLVAIPDLAVGSLCEAVSLDVNHRRHPTKGVLMPVDQSVTAKTRLILSWLSFHHAPLKRLVCVMTAGADNSIKTQWLSFYPDPQEQELYLPRYVSTPTWP